VPAASVSKSYSKIVDLDDSVMCRSVCHLCIGLLLLRHFHPGPSCLQRPLLGHGAWLRPVLPLLLFELCVLRIRLCDVGLRSGV
jgi:hypothetical protein